MDFKIIMVNMFKKIEDEEFPQNCNICKRIKWKF